MEELLHSDDPIHHLLSLCDSENRKLCKSLGYTEVLKSANRGYLLRLGKHEGKLSVTVIEALRQISELKGRKELKEPLTVKKALCGDKGLPFGFCLLKPALP